MAMENGGGLRHGSTGTSSTITTTTTNSSRYKSDPLGRKWSQPWLSTTSADECATNDGGGGEGDEQNYLVPRGGRREWLLTRFEEEEVGKEEDEMTLYTPVVDGGTKSATEGRKKMMVG